MNYAKLFDLSQDIICATDFNGYFKNINSAGTEILGYTIDELLSKPFMDFVFSEDHENTLSELQNLMKGKKTIMFENRYVCKDDSLRNISWNATPVLDEGLIYAIGRDITQQKKDQSKLLNTEALLKTALDNSQAGVAIAKAPDGKLTYVNEAGLLIRDKSRREVVIDVGIEEYVSKWKILDIQTKKELEPQDVPLAKALITGEKNSREFIIRRDNNEDRYVFANAAPVFDKKGNIDSAVVVFLDVTERKLAEKRLVETEARFRGLMEQSPIPIQIHAPNGALVKVNAAWYKLWNFDEEQAKQVLENVNIFEDEQHMKSGHHETILRLFAGEFVPPMMVKYNSSEAQKQFNVGGKRIETKTFKVTGYPVKNNKGDLSHVVLMFQDFTEKLKSEEKLKESEERFRAFMEHIPAKVFIKDENLKNTFFNKNLLDSFDISEDDMIGSDSYDLFEHSLAKELAEFDLKVLKSKQKAEKEIRFLEENVEKWDRNIVFPINLPDGRVNLGGISIDITESKLNSMKLMASENRYRSLFESARDAIWIVEDGFIIDVNQASVELFGFDNRSEMIGKTVMELSPESQPDGRRAIEEVPRIVKLALSGESQNFEWNQIKKDGTEFECEISVNRLIFDGSPHLLAIIRDISEKKESERKLKESELLFREFMDHLPAKTYIKDSNFDHIYGNMNARKFLDKLPEMNFAGSRSADFFEEDMAKKMEANDQFVLQSKKQVEHEISYELENRTIWERDLKFPIVKDDGTVMIGGISLDITELKNSEFALKKALAEVVELKNKYEKENIYLKEEINLPFNYENMVYASDEISEVLNQVELVANTNATVLLTGETGTGKEIIARAIHAIGKTGNEPLIKVNCGAIPSELIESELFGHKKGAFTGAVSNRVGKFQMADGGTLFLDEIGELPIEMQPKLLRVLQDGEVTPIGSSAGVKVDVRVVAATNRDLKEEIERGNFRQDLFFRLNVFPIHIPALRERKADIPVLLNHFVESFSKKYRKKIKSINSGDFEALKQYDWPGNVRELENLIERSVIISKEDHLRLNMSDTNSSEKRALDNLGKTLNDVQRDYIINVLKKTNWKINGPEGAAVILDVKPTTLRDRIRKLGIAKP